MSPALNRSSVIRRFEGSKVIEILDGITFDFYTGLPHMLSFLYVCLNLVIILSDIKVINRMCLTNLLKLKLC